MEERKTFLLRDGVEKFSRWMPGMDATAVETLLECLRISDEINHKIYDDLEKDHGLSKGKFSVLIVIYKERDQGIAPSAIAEDLQVSRATITGLIQRLEQSELLTRVPSASDGRMQEVKLTLKGKKLMDDILPSHFIKVSNLMKNLTIEERETLISLLKKIE